MEMRKAREADSEEPLPKERKPRETMDVDQRADSKLQVDWKEKERVLGCDKEVGKKEHSENRDYVALSKCALFSDVQQVAPFRAEVSLCYLAKSFLEILIIEKMLIRLISPVYKVGIASV